MLKVVGASWLQTRISTYILVAVALLGIGAIVLGEFGRIDNDGTYAATVSWNRKGGYNIDFWGQGNDLNALPRRAARAYYRTRIHEAGWSFVEIETSSNYPDAVQAYAAGLLEGSLTWQLIHHHWYNTIAAPCVGREEICEKIRRSLKENTAAVRDRADVLAADDPFWHMVRLFYAQLDGLEAGWRFAVRRSKKTADISNEDFLWLAMASDIPNFGPENRPTSERDFNVEAGGILLKYLPNAEELEGLLGIIHSTAAPYQKMLRLLKKYTFSYHVNAAKNSERVPVRSIVASSYPGALSSQDEYYMLYGQTTEDLMVVAGTPLAPTGPLTEQTEGDIVISGNSESYIVMSAARIMSANWLTTSAPVWARHLARREAPEVLSRPVQWVLTRAGDASVWIIEQHPAATHAIDYTNTLAEQRSIFCSGESVLGHHRSSSQQPVSSTAIPQTSATDEAAEIVKLEETEKIQKTVVKVEENAEVRDGSHEETSVSRKINSTLNSKLIGDTPGANWVLGFRGDLEEVPVPFGNIDTKIALINSNGVDTFEATSGPFWGDSADAFEWSNEFARVPHVGQPGRFQFDATAPSWAWF